MSVTPSLRFRSLHGVRPAALHIRWSTGCTWESRYSKVTSSLERRKGPSVTFSAEAPLDDVYLFCLRRRLCLGRFSHFPVAIPFACDLLHCVSNVLPFCAVASRSVS